MTRSCSHKSCCMTMSNSHFLTIDETPRPSKDPDEEYHTGTTLKLETDEVVGSPVGPVILASIIQAIIVKRCRVSQTVLVEIDSDCNFHRLIDIPTTLFAKLYDPAYSHGAREDEGGTVVE